MVAFISIGAIVPRSTRQHQRANAFNDTPSNRGVEVRGGYKIKHYWTLT